MELALHPDDHADPSNLVIWDISQSADRVPRGANVFPTVLPSAKCVVSEGGDEPYLRRLFGL